MAQHAGGLSAAQQVGVGDGVGVVEAGVELVEGVVGAIPKSEGISQNWSG
jgi:hypothetical protein